MQACKNLQQQKIHIIIFYSYNYLFLESSRNYIGKIKQTKKKQTQMKQKTWFWTERARACAATRPRSMKGNAWPERPRRLSTITTNATQRLRTKKKRFAKCDETVCVRLLLFSLIVCVCAQAARSSSFGSKVSRVFPRPGGSFKWGQNIVRKSRIGAFLRVSF